MKFAIDRWREAEAVDDRIGVGQRAEQQHEDRDR